MGVILLLLAADWEGVLGDLVEKEKAGFGGLSGVAVDKETGKVRICLSDRGIYVSESGGKSFKRAGDKQPTGRTETPGCLMLGPKGKLVSAFVYGSPIGVSEDGGASWSFMGKESVHVDWCAVDAGMKLVLAIKHEKDGLLLVSRDGGKSFEEAGKGHGPGWVFDGSVAVVSKLKEGLVRTTDGGKTWKPAGEHVPVLRASAQALPTWDGEWLWWLTEKGLIRTKDKGETWEKVGEVKEAWYGPVFAGKSMLVLTKAGVVESGDDGKSWGKPIPLPKEMRGIAGLYWIDYDPKGKWLYAMKMGSDLYRRKHGE